jgi:hypothetical protein
MRQIKFTAAEADVWDWAVDPAREYWEDDHGRDDGKHFEESPVRFTENGIAQYDDSDPDVIEDMIYRIDEQLRDMALEQGGIYADGRPDKERAQAMAHIPVINRVVRKMKASTVTNQPA